MLAIKNNIMAENAARHLGLSFDSLAKSIERLSSGLRINTAKDDAAGLAVRELMRADIAVLQQGARNALDGISMLQTMEGAMSVIDDNLIRMKELAQQAQTGTYSATQRIIMDGEFSEMADEIERISGAITFNSITMLDSDTGSVSIHVGTTETIDINNVDMSKSGLGIETGSGGVYIIGQATSGAAAATTAAWTTLADSGDADATLTISFEDSDASANDELDIEVTLAALSGGSAYTLQEIVDDINVVSQNLGNDADGNNLNYTAASVQSIMDGATLKYTVKLASRDATSDVCEMALTSTGNTTATGGWTTPADIDGTDFTAEVTDDGINILDADAAATALIAVTAAIEEKDTARAQFGYKMTRLESTVDVLGIQAENLIASESRISDVDVATEMAALTRTQVLAQAGIAMLAQANAMPQMALSLLR